METHELTCHPDTPAHASFRVEAGLDWQDGELVLRYCITGQVEAIRLSPRRADAGRRDGLWQTTCMELFVRIGAGPGYLEFNFAASHDWAAYCFTCYREGMAQLPAAVRVGSDQDPPGGEASIAVSLNPEGIAALQPGAVIAISAVIEEADGTKSYWALVHPPGKPDFHAPTCFAATLPAPQGS